MRKPLGIQKCDRRTDRRTDRPTDRPTWQGVESRVRDLKNRKRKTLLHIGGAIEEEEKEMNNRLFPHVNCVSNKLLARVP